MSVRAVRAVTPEQTQVVALAFGLPPSPSAIDEAQRLHTEPTWGTGRPRPHRGMAIMALAYSVGKHSGGQINCAVTWALCLSGYLPWMQAQG